MMNVKQPTQQEIKARLIERLRTFYPGSEVIQGYIQDEQVTVIDAEEHGTSSGASHVDLTLRASYGYKNKFYGFYAMQVVRNEVDVIIPPGMAEFFFSITKVYKVRG